MYSGKIRLKKGKDYQALPMKFAVAWILVGLSQESSFLVYLFECQDYSKISL
jgi:hypothetical protein